MNPSIMNKMVVHEMSALSDTTMPTLAVAFSGAPVAGEADSMETSQVRGATITIVPTGGTGSKLLITLAVQKVTSAGVATTDSTTSINGATYTTLKSVIDAINAVSGFTAWALHAPHSQSTDSDDYIALAETYLHPDGKPVECLYRDVSEDKTNYLRVGWPTERDSGFMRVINLSGTTTGNTNGTVKLYRDVYGGTLTQLRSFTQQTAETAYIDHDIVKGGTYEGPLLVAVASDNLTATSLRLMVAPAEF